MAHELELFQHQADFCTDFDHRYISLIGGYGSGKTKALAVKLMLLARLNKGSEGVALSPTYRMAKQTLVPAIEEELWLQHIPFKFNVSEMTFYIKLGHDQTILRILAAEHYRRAAGLNLAFFGVDEADLLSADTFASAWNMLISRLRSVKGKVFQGCAVSTPEGFKGCYKYWVEDVEKRVRGFEQRRMYNARTSDNTSLPPEYIEDLRSQYPPELLEAYLNGQFVNLKGLPVYSRYKPAYDGGNWTNLTLADFPDHALHIGLDFNKAINPCMVHVVSGNSSYLVDEIFGLRDTDECIRHLKAKYPKHEKHFYPDATNFEAISTYERAFGASRVHRRGQNPAVLDRVASLHLGMYDPETQLRRYLVNPKTCPNADKSFQKQVRDDDGVPDKKGGLDHAPDAAGYFQHYRFPVNRADLGQSALRL